MDLRILQHEYVFDHRIAEREGEKGCAGCALLKRRDVTECLAQRPDEWNGLMIIGEGPGGMEARLKTPFIGPAGKTLDMLLEKASIDRSKTYLTNASLCMPEGGKDKDKDAQVKSAVQHCRARLLAEIAYYQPRVILALGQAALDAVTGTENRIERRVRFDCPTCRNQNKWKVWRCAKCKTPFHDKYVVADPSDLSGKPKPPAEATPCCQAKWQPFIVKCETCGGLKTKPEVEHRFLAEYKIGEVAGGIFRADTLPIASILQSPSSVYVVPTYHPSFLNRKVETKHQKQIGGQFLAWAAFLHLQKANRLLTSDPVFPFRWRLAQEPEDIARYVASTMNGGGGAFATDIETDAKKALDVADIRSVAITHEDSDESLVIDTSQLPASHPMIRALCAFLSDPSKRKIFQNGIYDTTVIERVWQITVQGFDEDTLVAHNVIAPDEPHDLGHIAYLYTDTAPWKPPKKSKKEGLVFETKEQLFEYNARDTRCTAVSMKALRLEMDKEGVRHLHDLDVRKFKLAKEMTERGMPVDRKRMLDLGTEAQYEMETSAHAMRQIVGRIPDRLVAKDAGADREAFAFKPTNPGHIIWAMFAEDGPLKLTPTKFNGPKSRSAIWPMGTPTTEKTALLDFIEQPFVQHLMRFRQNQYLKSNIIDGNSPGPDMRMHPQWNPVGPRTGRWSSSPNWQNIKRKYRHMIALPEDSGRRIVGADAAQLEMRLIAALSGDKDLFHRCVTADESRKLEVDHDPHSFVSAHAFGRAFTELLLQDPHHEKTNARCACQTCTRRLLRDIAKRVFYGLGYGAGAETIREAIYDGGYDGPPITLETIGNVIRTLFTVFPRFGQWRDEVLQTSQRTGYVRDALLNRFRVFPLGDVDVTVAYNFIVQSTGASVMDVGILNLHEQLHTADPTAFIFAQVHDAVYVECATERVQAVSDLVTTCMSCEVRFHDDIDWMPLPATAHDGADWLEAA